MSPLIVNIFLYESKTGIIFCVGKNCSIYAITNLSSSRIKSRQRMSNHIKIKSA